MALHRWKTFKTDNQVNTVTQQANVDHCGVCGETPLALEEIPKRIERREYSRKINTRFPKSMKRNVMFGLVCLGYGIAISSMYKSNEKRKKYS